MMSLACIYITANIRARANIFVVPHYLGSGQTKLRAHAAMIYKKREISIYFRVRLG